MTVIRDKNECIRGRMKVIAVWKYFIKSYIKIETGSTNTTKTRIFTINVTYY